MNRLIVLLVLILTVLMTHGVALPDDFEMSTRPHAVERGWHPVDDDGYVWEYMSINRMGGLTIVARCEYTMIQWNGVEKWKGTYYVKSMDFSGNGFFDRFYDDANLDGLCGCVEWVNHNMIGDYYI